MDLRTFDDSYIGVMFFLLHHRKRMGNRCDADSWNDSAMLSDDCADDARIYKKNIGNKVTGVDANIKEEEE